MKTEGMPVMEKRLVRRGEVVRYLGISRSTFSEIVREGTLRAVRLRKGGRAYFDSVAVRTLAETMGRIR